MTVGPVVPLRSLPVSEGPQGAAAVHRCPEADVRVSVHGEQLSVQRSAAELQEFGESEGAGGDLVGDGDADVRDGAVLPRLHDAGGAGHAEHPRNGDGVLLPGLLLRRGAERRRGVENAGQAEGGAVAADQDAGAAADRRVHDGGDRDEATRGGGVDDPRTDEARD